MRSLPYPALQLVGLRKLNKEGRDEWSSLLNADAMFSVLTTIACDRQHAIIFHCPTRVRFLAPTSLQFRTSCQCCFHGSTDVHTGLLIPKGKRNSFSICFVQKSKIYNKCNCLKQYWKLCWRVNGEKATKMQKTQLTLLQASYWNGWRAYVTKMCPYHFLGSKAA